MKNKIKITTLCLVFSFTYSFAQVLTNQNPSSGASTSFAFIDAGSSSTYNGVANAGKGIIYPRTDLTAVTSFLDSGSLGSASYNPNYYDGIVVYNTATSGTAGIGSTEGTLSPGFWYYENTSGNSSGGTWKPMGGGVTDTPTFEPATEMDVNLSDPLVTPVISTETATSFFTFVNTRDRESGDKTTQIMNLPPPTPVGKLIIINNSANSLNVQFNPSVGGNNVVAAYRGVMLIATADGWLNLSE